jgi:hypothetical protein
VHGDGSLVMRGCALTAIHPAYRHWRAAESANFARRVRPLALTRPRRTSCSGAYRTLQRLNHNDPADPWVSVESGRKFYTSGDIVIAVVTKTYLSKSLTTWGFTEFYWFFTSLFCVM